MEPRKNETARHPPRLDRVLPEVRGPGRGRDCIRAQVGAVIVNLPKKVKGTGYNNSPVGVESCLARGYCYRVEHNIESGTRYETCRSIHAEQNAIIQAGEDNCVGSTIYVLWAQPGLHPVQALHPQRRDHPRAFAGRTRIRMSWKSISRRCWRCGACSA